MNPSKNTRAARRLEPIVAAAACTAFALWASTAQAGGPDVAVPVGPIEWLFFSMRVAVAEWQRSGQDFSRAVFVALAAINLTWLGVEVLTSGSFDLRGGILRLARELFVVSVFYSLIELGPTLATEIVQFFERAGQSAAGGSLQPTQHVLDKTIETTVGLVKEHGGSLLGLESIWLGLCAVCIIACVAFIGAVMWIVELFTYVTIGVGAILLGGGGSVWTRFLVANYLKFAGGSGIALYFLRFTQNFVLAHLEAWATEANAPAASKWLAAAADGSAGLGPETMFTMLSTVLIEAVLVVLAPTLALGLFAGGVSNIADYAGRRAASAALSSGVGQGVRSFAGAASSAVRSVRNSVSESFGAATGSGVMVLASAGGPKPAPSPNAGPGTPRPGAPPKTGLGERSTTSHGQGASKGVASDAGERPASAAQDDAAAARSPSEQAAVRAPSARTETGRGRGSDDRASGTETAAREMAHRGSGSRASGTAREQLASGGCDAAGTSSTPSSTTTASAGVSREGASRERAAEPATGGAGRDTSRAAEGGTGGESRAKGGSGVAAPSSAGARSSRPAHPTRSADAGRAADRTTAPPSAPSDAGRSRGGVSSSPAPLGSAAAAAPGTATRASAAGSANFAAGPVMPSSQHGSAAGASPSRPAPPGPASMPPPQRAGQRQAPAGQSARHESEDKRG